MDAQAALVVAAFKADLHPEEPSHTVSEFSFNSQRKRMTIIEHRPEGLIAYIKGAPEVMVDDFAGDTAEEKLLTSPLSRHICLIMYT